MKHDSYDCFGDLVGQGLITANGKFQQYVYVNYSCELLNTDFIMDAHQTSAEDASQVC